VGRIPERRSEGSDDALRHERRDNEQQWANRHHSRVAVSHVPASDPTIAPTQTERDVHESKSKSVTA
jgi:hypothetical protein